MSLRGNKTRTYYNQIRKDIHNTVTLKEKKKTTHSSQTFIL